VPQRKPVRRHTAFGFVVRPVCEVNTLPERRILARRFEIVLAPEAVEDLRSLEAHTKGAGRAALEEHLRHQPERVSKSRIKRMRGLSRPQYRLRVDALRVFYGLFTDLSAAI